MFQIMLMIFNNPKKRNAMCVIYVIVYVTELPETCIISESLPWLKNSFAFF